MNGTENRMNQVSSIYVSTRLTKLLAGYGVVNAVFNVLPELFEEMQGLRAQNQALEVKIDTLLDRLSTQDQSIDAHFRMAVQEIKDFGSQLQDGSLKRGIPAGGAGKDEFQSSKRDDGDTEMETGDVDDPGDTVEEDSESAAAQAVSPTSPTPNPSWAASAFSSELSEAPASPPVAREKRKKSAEAEEGEGEPLPKRARRRTVKAASATPKGKGKGKGKK